jgi:hypothetical protein
MKNKKILENKIKFRAGTLTTTWSKESSCWSRLKWIKEVKTQQWSHLTKRVADSWILKAV